MSTPSEAIPIFTGGRDFYVPAFEVKLRGRALPKDVVRDVVQVTYKDSLEDIDSFEISINNWDAAARTFKYSDGDTFEPGKELELWMGYYGADPLKLMIKGEITSLRPNFPATGQPTLAVSGLNLLHRLRSRTKSRIFKERTDSQIASEVVTALGFQLLPSPPPTGEKQHPYVIQDNQFDIVFLMERAHNIGYDIFVQEDSKTGKSQFYFGPPVAGKRPVYDLTFGKSLVEFQPELTTAGQVNRVRVSGWDAENKKKIEYTIEAKDLETTPVSKEDQGTVVESFRDREEVITDRVVFSEDEAKQVARGVLNKITEEMLKGNGSTLGLPDLRTGSYVRIGGMGTRFSGTYFVTATTHTISDGGYTTNFECRRQEQQ